MPAVCLAVSDPPLHDRDDVFGSCSEAGLCGLPCIRLPGSCVNIVILFTVNIPSILHTHTGISRGFELHQHVIGCNADAVGRRQGLVHGLVSRFQLCQEPFELRFNISDGNLLAPAEIVQTGLA